MIALISGLLGFLTSTFPDLLKLYKDKKDREHELSIMKFQAQLQAQGHTERMEEINVNADIAEINALAVRGEVHTGVAWVDALNGTVRPIICYCFFLMFSMAKIMAFVALSRYPSVPAAVYIETLWGMEDQAIFSTILGFYFGGRTMQKFRQGK